MSHKLQQKFENARHRLRGQPLTNLFFFTQQIERTLTPSRRLGINIWKVVCVLEVEALKGRDEGCLEHSRKWGTGCVFAVDVQRCTAS